MHYVINEKEPNPSSMFSFFNVVFFIPNNLIHGDPNFFMILPPNIQHIESYFFFLHLFFYSFPNKLDRVILA